MRLPVTAITAFSETCLIGTLVRQMASFERDQSPTRFISEWVQFRKRNTEFLRLVGLQIHRLHRIDRNSPEVQVGRHSGQNYKLLYH